jgi:hypothetical protein
LVPNGSAGLFLSPISAARQVSRRLASNRADPRDGTGPRGDTATADNVNQRETSLVPLFLQSWLRAPTWLVMGTVLLFVGTALVFGAATAGRGMGIAGVVLLLVALAPFCRGLVVWTEKVRLTGDHVARVTALSRRKIAWGRVELYSSGLLTDNRPYHAIYRLEGASGGCIRFRTRPDAFADLDALLRSRCTNAFVQDYLTGRITPSAAGDRFAAQARERFRRVAGRASRRYTLRAIAQVIALPAMMVLGLVGFIGSHYHGFALFYGPSDIAANFRRAANARRSFAQFQQHEKATPPTDQQHARQASPALDKSPDSEQDS